MRLIRLLLATGIAISGSQYAIASETVDYGNGPVTLTPGTLPPPLFNPDGTPFIPGSPLPGFEDGRYAYDPLTNTYVPLMPGDARPNPVDPYVGLVPLAPPLFNSDGTPFIPGTPLEMPERADGVRFSYVWDPATGLYMPTKPNGELINSNIQISSIYSSDGSISPDGGPITASLISVTVFDQVTGKEVSVTYRSNMPPVINPDGTTNDANVIGAKPFDLSSPQTSKPKSEQLGTWAVLDKNGVVISTIECSESLCGEDGKYGGQIEEPTWAKGGCPEGCKLVLQIPANPITGLSMGGFVSSATNKVTYTNGRFRIEGKEGDKNITRTIKNGVITDITGERVDLSTGIQLPSAIKDPTLKKQIDAVIADAEIEPIKTSRGYQLALDDELPAIDSSLKFVAVKPGAKPKILKISVDKTGELFLPTKENLSGYEIQIKRGKKVLNSISVD